MLTSLLCYHCHWSAEWALLDSFSCNGELVLIVCMKRTNEQLGVIASLCVVGHYACYGFILPNIIIPDYSVPLVNSWRGPPQEDISGT